MDTCGEQKDGLEGPTCGELSQCRCKINQPNRFCKRVRVADVGYLSQQGSVVADSARADLVSPGIRLSKPGETLYHAERCGPGPTS